MFMSTKISHIAMLSNFALCRGTSTSSANEYLSLFHSEASHPLRSTLVIAGQLG